MARVVINMSALQKYIAIMNRITDDICAVDKAYSNILVGLESEWRDEVYKDARDRFTHMQKKINTFLSKVHEGNTQFVEAYCDMYDMYINEPYERPVVKTDNVELIRGIHFTSEIKEYNVQTFEKYLESTETYTTAMREIIAGFSYIQSSFSRDFQLGHYDEIAESVEKDKAALNIFIADIENLAAFVKSRMDDIRKYL